MEFSKAISLNPANLAGETTNSLNPFVNCKYELVKLSNVCDLNKFKNQASPEKISTMNLYKGNVKLLPSSQNYDWWTNEIIAGEYINEGGVIALGVARYANIKKHKGKFVSANNKLISIKQDIDILFDYVYLLLEIYAQNLYKSGSQYPQFDTKKFNEFQIPLPPLESQQKIISVIESIESKITNLEHLTHNFESKKQEILKEALKS